jgi:hypothetical protein
VLGADFAYIGSAFIATKEANAVEGYKEMITTSSAEDIVYSNLFTGVHGNYLKPSIVKAGLNPDDLPTSDPTKMSFGTDASGERTKPKAWKEIWGSGQGVGSVGKVLPAAELIARFRKEYEEAGGSRAGLGALAFTTASTRHGRDKPGHDGVDLLQLDRLVLAGIIDRRAPDLVRGLVLGAAVAELGAEAEVKHAHRLERIDQLLRCRNAGLPSSAPGSGARRHNSPRARRSQRLRPGKYLGERVLVLQHDARIA